MPRPCTICTHDQREEIDKALVSGTPYRNISKRFSVSMGALSRHRADHLPSHLAKAQEAREVAQADDLLAQVRDLQTKALRILARAEKTGRLRTALAGIREARANLELLAKLLGELQQEGTVNIVLAPEWVELRTVILAALTPYPDARLAVAQALEAGHAQG